MTQKDSQEVHHNRISQRQQIEQGITAMFNLAARI